MDTLSPFSALQVQHAGGFTLEEFFNLSGQQDVVGTAGLTAVDFFHAAQWTYHHLTELPPSPFTLVEEGFNENSGFYGAALQVDGPGQADQIVVAFEGTDPSSDLFKTNPVFVAAQLAADAQVYRGQVPDAYTDALNFTKDVIEAAEARGISKEDVHVTGHSLGGAEAQYVAAQLDLDGLTFGAPGIAASAIPDGSTPEVTNYVVYGDPVGNYSADPPNRLSNILFSDDIIHFGDVKFIGSLLGALQLNAANSLLAPDNTISEKLGGLALLADAVDKYHLPHAYENALDSLMGAGTMASGWFDHVARVHGADLWT
ncbi:lipase family protein [Microvirga massiliensis]|uniref:lipase family protein n=1 Tax=Microvirga massiliensis TaxID=1033741 RepID=UPI000660F667|nr:hypothetical protein [Microvirga massiliensis]